MRNSARALWSPSLWMTAALSSTVLCSVLALGCASTDRRDPQADSGEPFLTLDRLLSGPSLTGPSPSSPTWSPDSERLAFRWREPSAERSEIWLVEADGSDLRPLTAGDGGRSGPGPFVWLPDGRGLLYVRAGELRQIDLAGRTRRIGPLEGGAFDLQLSPDGRFASFLRGGDLYTVRLDDGQLIRRTEVAIPSISEVPLGRYRRREVEIGTYTWGGPTYAWSPDGRTIAVHHVDRRNVRKVPFPHYLGEETDPNLVRRGYPGDANELRTVGLLRLSEDGRGATLELLDLPGQDLNKIVDFSWSDDGKLLIDRDSDTAEDRWLHVLDPETGELRELWYDQRSTRVYTSAGSAWHPDGSVVMLGDLGDRYGLYALSPDGGEPRRLSNAAFDVTSSPVVTPSGYVFYQSNEPSPYETHAFRVSLDGSDPIRLTTRPGQNRPIPSPDGRHVAVLHDSDTSPTELLLVGLDGDGAREQQITDSQPEGFDELPWPVARYATFPSLVDDTTLHARILEPADLDPDHSYPVLFGPVYSNTVRNRWGGFYGMLQRLLVEKGYIVVQVDVRGSTGYGRPFREDFLGDFAGKDLEDLESAVTYMESLPHVDPDRIGIWGSSYGGTLTVYSLLKKPGLFDAGVACAAAVDPFFFGSDDVAIVRRPDSLPEAFERGAAQYAENLEDPLLLIHGMQDQIAPFKTVVDLAEALMRAGKDFDFAFAPAGTHGWTRPNHYARYLLGKLIAHFDRHLKAAME